MGPGGIEYEAYPRHVESIVKDLNLENDNPVSTPGENSPISRPGEETLLDRSAHQLL